MHRVPLFRDPLAKMENKKNSQPQPYHVLGKPTGAQCNLDCVYCFYLSKEKLYPGSEFRMSEEILEHYIRQLIKSHSSSQVSIAWQGGEPTLMGLDFFRHAVRVAEHSKQPGQEIQHSIQTNGVLLNDEWAEFFGENHFLVGISVDGPAELHDGYRKDKGGQPSHARVISGLQFLKNHQVDYNILCTVNAVNSLHPLRVYRYFRDTLQTQYIQFIPIVERIQKNNTVGTFSVEAKQWGRFLIEIFDEWVRQDVGKVFITTFEDALANWARVPAGTCVFNPTCGRALALEHNGDLYSCDHFVEINHLLGNIRETPLGKMVNSEFQQKFGRTKQTSLPKTCRECSVRFACHGECPKNRFLITPDGETGLNYLCDGYKSFFQHIDLPMRFMENELRNRRSPANVMAYLHSNP
jgi:uncharacterized protein